MLWYFQKGILRGSFITASLFCLICNIYVVWLTALESRALQRSYATVEQMRGVTRSVLIALLNAETGARGYLMTGDELYLSPYYTGAASIGEQLTTLRLLPLDERQRDAVAHLSFLTSAHLQELARVIGLQRTQGRDAAEQRILTGTDKTELDTLKAFIDAMIVDLSQSMESLQHYSDVYLDISTYCVLFAAFWVYMLIFLTARRPVGDA